MFVGKEFVAAMGKKGKWLGAVKKVFSPESKEKKEEVINLFMAALAWCSPLTYLWKFLCRISSDFTSSCELAVGLIRISVSSMN